jgi:hypothetical protein
MKTFSHKRPIRDEAGDILELRPASVSRVTVGTLGFNHGPDKRKPLVVTLADGDLICFRPAKTRRTKCARAIDVYEWLLRSEAMQVQMAKLREKKARKAQRLADLRQKRAEKRLFTT